MASLLLLSTFSPCVSPFIFLINSPYFSLTEVSPTSWMLTRLAWRSLRIMQTPGTGFLCKHASGFLWFFTISFVFTDYGAHLWVETFLRARSNKINWENLTQFPVCLCFASGLVITMVVSLLFILLLRYTADVLLWLLIFGVIAAIGYGES